MLLHKTGRQFIYEFFNFSSCRSSNKRNSFPLNAKPSIKFLAPLLTSSSWQPWNSTIRRSTAVGKQTLQPRFAFRGLYSSCNVRTPARYVFADLPWTNNTEMEYRNILAFWIQHGEHIHCLCCRLPKNQLTDWVTN